MKKNFEDLVVGHTFKIEEAGRTDRFQCAFCGVYGQNFVSIRRDDGLLLKVGKTCLRKIGLELPKSMMLKKGKKAEEPAGVEVSTEGEAQQEIPTVVNVAEEKEGGDDIEEILSDIEKLP
jgi:hypothetical protein